jgi:hypothetical protein
VVAVVEGGGALQIPQFLGLSVGLCLGVGNTHTNFTALCCDSKTNKLCMVVDSQPMQCGVARVISYRQRSVRLPLNRFEINRKNQAFVGRAANGGD